MQLTTKTLKSIDTRRHNIIFRHFQHASAREVLSLEEILAEGANGNTSDRDRRPGRQMCIVDDPFGRGSLASSASDSSQVLKLTKQQIKTLQEAMYHSAESGHLGKGNSSGRPVSIHFAFLNISAGPFQRSGERLKDIVISLQK